MVVLALIVQSRADGSTLFLKHRSILPSQVAHQLADATHAHLAELSQNGGYKQPRQVRRRRTLGPSASPPLHTHTPFEDFFALGHCSEVAAGG